MKPLLFFTLLFCSLFALGQNNILVETKRQIGNQEAIDAIMQKNEAYVATYPVNIDISKALSCDVVIVQFEENRFFFNKKSLDVRGRNNFCFVGNDSRDNFILMSVLNDNIQGVIETEDEIFYIETASLGDYVIIKVDPSKLKNEGEESFENESYNNTANNEFEYYSPIQNRNDSNSERSNNSNEDCKIRVAVLYTEGASQAVSDINNHIATAIDLTNLTFVNSEIDSRVELAYAGFTDYIEPGTTEDDYHTCLQNFINNNDGYMDEIHTLRNQYSADVCVLLVNIGAYCGLSTVYVNENLAFCVVTAGTCATTNYSFGHEIGHLLGCRHDVCTENINTPYAYGHGYFHIGNNNADSWRTIMAYNTCCAQCGITCKRQPYWSNPNVNFNGIPTGTASTHNNARVWNERSDAIMSFRQPSNNITITGNDIDEMIYGDVVAKQTITTSGVVEIVDGSYHMKAGNEITINSYFSVGLGAELTIATGNVHNCGTDNLQNPNIVLYDNNISSTNERNCSYSILQDLTGTAINISYSLKVDGTLSIIICDTLGNKVKTIFLQNTCKSGDYIQTLPLSDFEQGTYLIKIIFNGYEQTEKLTIK